MEILSFILTKEKSLNNVQVALFPNTILEVSLKWVEQCYSE